MPTNLMPVAHAHEGPEGARVDAAQLLEDQRAGRRPACRPRCAPDASSSSQKARTVNQALSSVEQPPAPGLAARRRVTASASDARRRGSRADAGRHLTSGRPERAGRLRALAARTSPPAAHDARFARAAVARGVALAPQDASRGASGTRSRWPVRAALLFEIGERAQLLGCELPSRRRAPSACSSSGTGSSDSISTVASNDLAARRDARARSGAWKIGSRQLTATPCGADRRHAPRPAARGTSSPARRRTGSASVRLRPSPGISQSDAHEVDVEQVALHVGEKLVR